MISWLQSTFQHHFKLVFFLILAGTILSFIFTIGNMGPGLGGGGQKALNRPFFGHNLGNEADKALIGQDADLSVYLQAGYAALEGVQFQQYALQRIAALSIADRLKIPDPTAPQLADYVKTLRLFAGDDGRFDAQRYNAFRDSLKTNPRLHEADVSRVLRDDYRIRRAESLFAGPGYVLPVDVKTQLARADSLWTLAVAVVDYASFNPAITVNEVALQKFYDDNAFRYEVPPRLSADYVEFPASDYLGQVTVTDAEAQAYYAANPARFPKPAATAAAPAKPLLKIADAPKTGAGADFAAVRPQVVAALQLAKASQLAARAAADLTVAIYGDKFTSENSPGFAAFLASHKLALKSAPPFTQDNPPAALGWTSDLAEQAFHLGTERFYSDALPTANGSSVVLFWKQTLPAYKPQLVEVRDRVLADYKEGERRKRFVELGAALHSLLENRLKAGDTFAKAVDSLVATSSTKIELKTFPAFTLRQPPPDIDSPILGTLDRLQQGQVSAMVATPDKGYLVYAEQKKAPDLTEANPDYQSIKAQLMQLTASLNSGLYLGELVDRELAKAGPVPDGE